jgi:ribosomal protein S18 acetylase RimI-like enzyme
MDVVVRKAREADFDQVSVIFADENAFHSQLLPERFQIADPIMTRDWFNEILTNENRAVLVAELENVLVGLVLINLMNAPDDPIFQPRRYAYIEEVAVVKEQRGYGIGRLLMTKTHEWIAAQGVNEVELFVWERNRNAIRFYEELGYLMIRRGMKLDLD